MNDFNKVISFVLGIIVVIVFFAVITGRLTKVPFLSKAKVTPTPTAAPSPTAVQVMGNVRVTPGQTVTTSRVQTTNTYTNGQLNTIPNTGAPTLLLPMAFSSLFGGLFLRKAKKK